MQHDAWPLWLAVTVLVVASLGAALVSEWFVSALEPAIEMLHISQAFAGIVVVAIAGNAVENVAGIRLAAKNRPDYAMSVILNSSLVIALCVIPALVLLSFVLGGPVLDAGAAAAAHRRAAAHDADVGDHRQRRRDDLARGRRADRPVLHHRGGVLVGMSVGSSSHAVGCPHEILVNR